MKSNTHTVSNPTSPASLPNTGFKFLDRAVDQLTPDAKIAILALLERHGQDDRVNLVRNRLLAYAEQFLEDPAVVTSICAGYDDSEMEEAFEFWSVLRDEWRTTSN